MAATLDLPKFLNLVNVIRDYVPLEHPPDQNHLHGTLVDRFTD